MRLIILVVAAMTVACSEGDGVADLPSVASSCQEVLTSNPNASSGTYTIDLDGDGPDPSFETICEMSLSGGGWTLVGVVDDDAIDSWTEPTAWTDASTFGSSSDGDYKNPGWSALSLTQVLMIGSGTKTTDTMAEVPSLASVFSSSSRVSLSGTEDGWDYGNGDFTTDNDHEFFGEAQNPPTTTDVNYSHRNACILATAYDGWDRGGGVFDDQVQGFGCTEGFGGSPDGLCGNESCGDAIREDRTSFYIR
jgi:hypothetical protein